MVKKAFPKGLSYDLDENNNETLKHENVSFERVSCFFCIATITFLSSRQEYT
jgi:hypothetical protein